MQWGPSKGEWGIRCFYLCLKREWRWSSPSYVISTHTAQLLMLWLVSHYGHEGHFPLQWIGLCLYSVPSRLGGASPLLFSMRRWAGCRPEWQHVVLYKQSFNCELQIRVELQCCQWYSDSDKRNVGPSSSVFDAVFCGDVVMYWEMGCVTQISHAHVLWQVCSNEWWDDGCGLGHSVWV